MIKDADKWRRWEKERIRREAPDFLRNLAIYEALYEEVVALGVLPPKDPLEGIEFKIHLVRVLNVSGTAR